MHGIKEINGMAFGKGVRFLSKGRFVCGRGKPRKFTQFLRFYMKAISQLCTLVIVMAIPFIGNAQSTIAPQPTVS